MVTHLVNGRNRLTIAQRAETVKKRACLKPITADGAITTRTILLNSDVFMKDSNVLQALEPANNSCWIFYFIILGNVLFREKL